MTRNAPSVVMHFFEFIAAGTLIGGVYSAGSLDDPVMAAVIVVALFFIYLERKFRLETYRLKSVVDRAEENQADESVSG